MVYRFELALDASPERLWPLVADTNRFNRDAGVPPVEKRGTGRNARRWLRLSKFGIGVEWEEEPFEWVRPHRFSVFRRYSRGPLESMRVRATLAARAGGGTQLVYEVRAMPRGALGRAAAAVEIGILSRRRFERVFRRYDGTAARGDGATRPTRSRLASGGSRRLEAARALLVADGVRPDLAERLVDLVRHGDDISLGRMRPYVLADAWAAGRRETLELCLRATQRGLLELRWELLCPLCRGAASRAETLAGVTPRQHCETCLIDFEVDFARSVELTFRPTTSIRRVALREFCVAGPQITPHVVAQQLVPAGERRSLELALEPGGHRLRALGASAALAVAVEPDGALEAEVSAGPGGWEPDGLVLAAQPMLHLRNATADEQLVVLERTAWSDLAATAAEATSLQLCRDLLSPEALRPAEPISVGTLTVVFTDLRDSTRYYREVGDASAFASVSAHFDVLRRAVEREGGTVVKSMGDAIMCVFARPVQAVRTMLAAQRSVAGQPLALKVGIHTSACIAVDQNDVLDYFGSTVNLAARLVSLSSGDDLVVSADVLDDPEVAALGLEREPVEAVVKGFEGQALALWRVRAAPA